MPDEPLLGTARRPDTLAFEPVAEGLIGTRAVAVELVREGYLLHYGESRLYAFDDPDLSLLAGDRMYAAGLDALARAGDLVAVDELAALIEACAIAHGGRAAAAAAAEAGKMWSAAIDRLGARAILARG